jgi:hypothetical protein
MPASTTVSYTTASNQVSATNGTTFIYDAAGDVIQDSLNSYLYDAEGRLSTPRTKTCPRGPCPSPKFHLGILRSGIFRFEAVRDRF